MTDFQAPKGVPDYLPPDSAEFVAVRDGLLNAARLAGYGHIELPVFEDTALFARGVGESTDVVSKEMYTFADRGDRSVTLRPEGTAGVMRAVIEHGLDRGALPAKLRYSGPFFRYERPQAGRYRQLQQVGVEAIGIDDPAEAEALRRQLLAHIGQERFRYTHFWQAHDVLFWDNRSVNHARDTWDPRYLREMHRAQAGGSVPF